ncbi:MAG: polyketide cyclase, partial [Nocardioides sp.]
TVESCAAPESFAVTGEFGGMVSWLTVTLTEATEGTTLELVHESPVDPELWAQYGPGAVGLGWDGALLGLGMHVETGEAVDPAYAASFNFSPEGQQLLRAAAEGWRDAAVADGDDPEAAARAADGAYAAYTTAPDA